MSQRIIEISPRLAYTVAGSAGSNTYIPIGPRVVEMPEGVTCFLVTRVTTGNSFGQPTNTIAVEALNAVVSDEDPSVLILGASALSAPISVNPYADGANFPKDYTAAFAAAQWKQISLRLNFTFGVAGTLTITAGVDMMIRDK